MNKSINKKSLFDKLTRFQITIRDRKASANILSSAINYHLTKEERKNLLVLGIPRGGIIVADVIARKLKTLNFDIVIPQRLLIPNDEENGFGAIMEDGSIYLDSRIVNKLSILPEYIESEKIKQILEIKRRSLLYRNSSNLQKYNKKINSEDLTVILVDDGAVTGASLISVARWLKNRNEHKYKKLIITIPVVPKKSVELLKEECDHLISIIQPVKFQTVSKYYQDFLPVNDEQVINILKKHKMLYQLR